MKKNVLTLLGFLFLFCGVYAQRSIIVANNSEIDRKGEIVEVKGSALKNSFKLKQQVLKNSKNEEIPYQLIYNDKKELQSLLFQASVKAGKSETFVLTEGKPSAVKALTYARFIPERKDDFAWENNLAAYRMYGPALAKENPSNGVDLWLKRTNELIVDKFYNDELKNGLSYHVDHGQGLDCYKVGHTLGAGGIAPYVADKLWVGNHYDTYKVIENGPLRSVFTLTYNSVVVGENTYKQTITITTDAGAMLNKAVVRYEGKKQPMKLAGGIFLHDGKGVLKSNSTKGYIAYAEDAVSDAKIPSGRNYVGVFIPGKGTSYKKDEEHALIMADYKAGKEFTYYFGGGWSKWGFPTDDDWFKAIEQFRISALSPLKVKVK